MKEIIIVLGCLSILMSSCKTSNDVVSNGIFQKRKYTKGYYKNNRSIAKAKRENNSTDSYTYVETNKDKEEELELNKEIKENVVASKNQDIEVTKNEYEHILYPNQKNKNELKREDCGDKLILKNGDEVEAKIISVGTKDITYKKCNNIDGPTYTINKSDVFMVKYKNGEKDVFNVETNTENEKKEDSQQLPVEVLSIASMSSGILAVIFLFWLGLILGGLFTLAAIIFGIISLVKQKKNKGKYSDSSKAFAWIGLIIGILMLLTFGLIFAEVFDFYW